MIVVYSAKHGLRFLTPTAADAYILADDPADSHGWHYVDHIAVKSNSRRIAR